MLGPILLLAVVAPPAATPANWHAKPARAMQRRARPPAVHRAAARPRQPVADGDPQQAQGCAAGRLTGTPALPGYASGIRAVAAGVEIGWPAGDGDGSERDAWSKCSTAHMMTTLAGKGRIARVTATVHYRLARVGLGTAQLIAYVNGVPGLAVATGPFGEGVLPIVVPGDRFGTDRKLEITLFLHADRLAPDAMVAAEVRDVRLTVTEARPPEPPCACAPPADAAASPGAPAPPTGIAR